MEEGRKEGREGLGKEGKARCRARPSRPPAAAARPPLRRRRRARPPGPAGAPGPGTSVPSVDISLCISSRVIARRDRLYRARVQIALAYILLTYIIIVALTALRQFYQYLSRIISALCVMLTVFLLFFFLHHIITSFTSYIFTSSSSSSDISSSYTDSR